MSLSGGVKALEWSQAEMARENPPTVATRAKWFRLCERNGVKLVGPHTPDSALESWNHCAAGASAAMVATIPEPLWPHRPRAGAKELMRDAIRRGTWLSIADVRAGRGMPDIGDLAIYDRSKPGRPETNWWGHVDRVSGLAYKVPPITSERQTDFLGFGNLGANEVAKKWREQDTLVSAPRLLGFIRYPMLNAVSGVAPAVSLLDEQELHALEGLLALTLNQSLAEALSDDSWRTED